VPDVAIRYLAGREDARCPASASEPHASERRPATTPHTLTRPIVPRGCSATAPDALSAIFRLTRCGAPPIPHFTDGAPRSTTWWPSASTVFGIVGGAELIRVTGSGDRCPSRPGVSIVSGAVAPDRGG